MGTSTQESSAKTHSRLSQGIVMKPMHTQLADCHRLTLLIQRLLDADTLCDAEGAALLIQTEAVCRSVEAGDSEAIHQHIVRVVRFTEELISADVLALSDGWALIATANHLLAEETL